MVKKISEEIENLHTENKDSLAHEVDNAIVLFRNYASGKDLKLIKIKNWIKLNSESDSKNEEEILALKILFDIVK